MIPRLLAETVFLIHILFVIFAVAGGLFLVRYPGLIYLHLPAAIWSVAVEWGGWICPLTRWENHFRRLAGLAGYGEGFLEHYLLPILYPVGLTRNHQFWLGSIALLINLFAYVRFLRRGRKRKRPSLEFR